MKDVVDTAIVQLKSWLIDLLIEILIPINLFFFVHLKSTKSEMITGAQKMRCYRIVIVLNDNKFTYDFR